MSELQAEFRKHTLTFERPMGTSRGVLHTRDVFILSLRQRSLLGLGECAPLAGLSQDDRPDYETQLQRVCQQIGSGVPVERLDLREWPSIRFGLETAMRDLATGGNRKLFDTPFTRGDAGMAINGLVVMADLASMKAQIASKIASGFDCIKIKIGAHDLAAECRLLAAFRDQFPAPDIQLRLDANGAFAASEALEKLQVLSQYSVHSVEQPIRPGQWQAMAEICASSPVPVALDEELIGIDDNQAKDDLLAMIKPHFIVLKPSLVGGFEACEAWIRSAREMGICYWITSMLESNIGLNAISQWTSTLEPGMHQGLGTGQLYLRNFRSRLAISDGKLYHSPDIELPATLSELHLS